MGGRGSGMQAGREESIIESLVEDGLYRLGFLSGIEEGIGPSE